MVKAGDVLADGPACDMGELALGQNVLVAFMPWQGYNFEDSILVSERIAKDDVFTSIHIEEFECVARDTKLGKEEITRDIPNVGEEALKDLDDSGIVRIGAEVRPGDILVGKITPKGETQLSPEEKLLRAIFGEKAGDVRDSSLKVPPGVGGIVINARVFSRKGTEKDERARDIEDQERARIERTRDEEIKILRDSFYRRVREILVGKTTTGKLVDDKGKVLLQKGAADRPTTRSTRSRASTGARSRSRTPRQVAADAARPRGPRAHARGALPRQDRAPLEGRRAAAGRDQDGEGLHRHQAQAPGRRQDGRTPRQQGRHQPHPARRGHAVPARTARPVDLVLNPLGVPSRMNVGQILETHLGWGAYELGRQIQRMVEEKRATAEVKEHAQASTRAIELLDGFFDKLADDEVEARSPRSSKRRLHGLAGVRRRARERHQGRARLAGPPLERPGDPLRRPHRRRFDQNVTVGIMYMLKLHHLVDDKIHARSIGPYSLVTQQPLGGKAQFGGQRLGEMEVWAMEAYGAAYALQEFLTVKCDDVHGPHAHVRGHRQGRLHPRSGPARELQRAHQGAAVAVPQRRAGRGEAGRPAAEERNDRFRSRPARSARQESEVPDA